MIRWIGCPESNFRRGRPFGLRPEAIVVHLIDGSFAAGEGVFRDPTAHKSAHYAISHKGEVHQYVDENDTAFHAGIVVNPSWPLLKPRVNPNFYTIGIEHEGRPDDVWPEEQLSASASLIAEVAARWHIPLDQEHVIRHHQIRASKTCPGNWLRLGELLNRALTPMALSAAAASSAVAATEVSTTHTGLEIDALPSTISAVPVFTDTQVVPSSPVTDALAPLAETPRVVRTVRNVNLRRERPMTSAQVIRVIAAHTDVVVKRFEIGECVDGNAYWYADVQGNYLWAGATNSPEPG